MIHESSPWKASLLRDADLITRWALKAPSERRSFLIERRLFLATYSLRKLSDDHKLSTQTLAAPVIVTLFPPLKPSFSGLVHSLDRYFDLERPLARTLTWRRVLNMMIHSVVFADVVDQQNRCVGFFVTSDGEQERGLVQVELAAVLALMRSAAADYPTTVRQSWDETAKRWVTWAGHE